jgi:hypothetical protein
VILAWDRTDGEEGAAATEFATMALPSSVRSVCWPVGTGRLAAERLVIVPDPEHHAVRI